ncbi:MAG: hypothetical protein QOH79_1351, partial [Acidimicrobiaceae bacterium]
TAPATTAAPTTAAPETTTTTAPVTTTTAPAPTTTTAPVTTSTSPPPPPAPPPPSPLPPSPPPQAPATSPTQWEVQPGESFWSVAVAIADTRAGGQATTSAVDAMWRALIDANREQLPKPNNPSLLYVGTILTIPP